MVTMDSIGTPDYDEKNMNLTMTVVTNMIKKEER